MRYSKEHKAETRERILDTAAPLFRRHGLDGTSVDELMAAAGLTRGGFYAHFKSKEALAIEIMARDTGLVRMMKDRPGQSPAELSRQALGILADYMAPENRQEVAEGCPLVSMPVDVARGPRPLRRGYAKRFLELVRQLRRGMTGRRDAEADAIAASVLAVGGVLFARSCDDPEQAAKIEQACRRHVGKLLKEPR